MGSTALRLYSWLVLFKGLVLIGRDYYNVTKHTITSTAITLIEGVVGVMILGTILGYFMGLDGIWIGCMRLWRNLPKGLILTGRLQTA